MENFPVDSTRENPGIPKILHFGHLLFLRHFEVFYDEPPFVLPKIVLSAFVSVTNSVYNNNHQTSGRISMLRFEQFEFF